MAEIVAPSAGEAVRKVVLAALVTVVFAISPEHWGGSVQRSDRAPERHLVTGSVSSFVHVAGYPVRYTDGEEAQPPSHRADVKRPAYDRRGTTAVIAIESMATQLQPPSVPAQSVPAHGFQLRLSSLFSSVRAKATSRHGGIMMGATPGRSGSLITCSGPAVHRAQRIIFIEPMMFNAGAPSPRSDSRAEIPSDRAIRQLVTGADVDMGGGRSRSPLPGTYRHLSDTAVELRSTMTRVMTACRMTSAKSARSY